MAYQVTALYDQESGEAPLKWGKNAVAEGEFSANAGRVMVDDVLCTPVSWTASEVVFVPVASSRPDGNYSVHFDNEPLVLAFVTHPQDQTISATAPVNEYLHDFTTKDIGAWTHTRASVATAPDEAGVIQTYTTDQPAWYKNQGLQLEAASTNTLQSSDDLTTAAWTRTNATVSGDEVYATASNGRIYSNNQDITAEQTLSGIFEYVDNENGAGQDITVQLTPDLSVYADNHLTNGSKETYSYTANTRFVFPGFRLPQGFVKANVTGLQCEAGTFRSSYIPTSQETVTRADTACSATFAELGAPLPAGGVTNDFCFQARATLLVDMDQMTGGGRVLSIYDSLSNVVNVQILGGIIRMEMVTSAGNNVSVDVLQTSAGSPKAGDAVDFRGKISATDGAVFWVNGAKSSNGTATYGFGAAVGSVAIGMEQYAGDRANVVAGKVRLVPESRSDEDIESWT